MTISGTAGSLLIAVLYYHSLLRVYNIGIDDYDEITSSDNPLVPFTSDPLTHRQCFNVTIVDDGVLEGTERFNLNLTLAEGSTVPVVVDPDVSEVEIVDQDCKFMPLNNRLLSCLFYVTFSDIEVGFERIFTRVDENIGSFELCVQIFTDTALLPTNIDFTFSLDLITVTDTAGMS